MGKEKIEKGFLKELEAQREDMLFSAYIMRMDNVRAGIFDTLSEMGFNYKAFEGYVNISKEEEKESLQYLYRKRKLSFDRYTAENSAFLKTNMGDDYHERTIYMSHYTTTCIARLSKKEIYSLSENEDIESIMPYFDTPVGAMGDDVTVRQIRADSVTGTSSALFNFGSGYRGEGISFGNISAGYYIYERQSPQITNKGEGELVLLPVSDTLPTVRNFHSTAIVSQMVGQAVNVGGVVYEGIVPEATLYFTPTSLVAQVYIAVEKMLDYGVYIINYSAGRINESREYSAFDLQMDILISNQNFTFVVASGNVTDITNPGLSYNAVTVGNVATKNDDNTPLAPPYDILCNGGNCSGYRAEQYLTNKPDISAPGAYISYVSDVDRVVSRPISGTSFSAPYVAAVAVQMMQAGGYMNFLALKSALLLGANFDIISASDNPVISGNLLREKTGAGLLDAVGAVEAVFGTNISASLSSEVRVSQYPLYLSRGERLRAVLCFEKNDSVLLRTENQNSIILSMTDSGGITVAQSLSEKDNVHIFEYTSQSGGEYQLLCQLIKSTENALIRYSLSYRIF